MRQLLREVLPLLTIHECADMRLAVHVRVRDWRFFYRSPSSAYISYCPQRASWCGSPYWCCGLADPISVRTYGMQVSICIHIQHIFLGPSWKGQRHNGYLLHALSQRCHRYGRQPLHMVGHRKSARTHPDARATPMMLPSKQTSGIVILITLATTCLFCCSFVGLCCGGLPNAVIYVSAVGVVIALLGYTLLLAWVGVGTYLAAEVQESTGENCINYYVYLAFFYAFILVLLLFSLVSLVWKLRNPVKENLLSKLPIPA